MAEHSRHSPPSSLSHLATVLVSSPAAALRRYGWPDGPLTAPDALALAQALLARLTQSFPNGADALCADNLWLDASGMPHVEAGTRQSLDYLPPEQHGVAGAADARADLYALGVLLCRLLGDPALFPRGDALGRLEARFFDSPELPANVPEGLRFLCETLVARTPERRYQTAAGLRHDLETALGFLAADGTIPLFPLKLHDWPARIVLAGGVWARDALLAELEDFARPALAERLRLLEMAGPAGVGKSALVEALLVRLPARVARVRLVPDCPVRPFPVLAEAARSLIRRSMSLPDARLAELGQRLNASLGDAAEALSRVLPELAALIGTRAVAPELPPVEARNRLEWLFERFFLAFATRGEPLVLLVDGLQWADAASLKVLAGLVRADTANHLLLVGVYRDDALPADHPWHAVRAAAERHGLACRRSRLGGLPAAAVTAWLAESLGGQAGELPDAAACLVARTGGNPLFIQRLLAASLADGSLVRDADTGVFSLDRNRMVPGAASLDECILSGIDSLAEPAGTLLSQVAAIGFGFDLASLAALLPQQSPDRLAVRLAALAEQGFVTAVPGEARAWAFCDARVHEVARGRLDEAGLAAANARLADVAASPFMVADRLCRATPARNAAEAARRARLFAVAAEAAQRMAAFDTALYYAEAGLACAQGWPSVDAGGLRRLALLAASVAAPRERVDTLAEAALAAAKDAADEVEIQLARLTAAVGHDDLRAAIDIGRAALVRFGEVLPEGVSLPELAGRRMALLKAFGTCLPGAVLSAAPASRSDAACLRLIHGLLGPAYFVEPALVTWLFLVGAERSLRRGPAPESGLFLVGAAMALIPEGENRLAQSFGDAGRCLAERDAPDWLRARVATLDGIFLAPWRAPLPAAVPALKAAQATSLSNGDPEYAAYAAHVAGLYAFHSARELEALDAELAKVSDSCRRLGQRRTLWLNQALRQHVRKLRGKSADACRLQGDGFDADAFLPREPSADAQALAFNVHHYQAQACAMAGRFGDALAHSRAAAPYLGVVAGSYMGKVYAFYHALILLALQHGRPVDLEARREIARHWRRLRRAARLSPVSFAAMQWLIAAEVARLNGRSERVHHFRLYFRALRLARDAQLWQFEAIVWQRTAEAFEAAGHFPLTEACEREAYRGYSRWGALGVCRALHARQPGWDVPQEAAFDIAALVDASRQLARETQPEAVLAALARLARQHAGATRVVVYLPDGEGWARGAQSGEGRSNALPADLLKLALEGREEGPLHESSAAWGATPVKERPATALLLPIAGRGNAHGVLYLEHADGRQAFPAAHRGVARVLAAEAAASLDSARLYGELSRAYATLERVNQELEDKVEARTAELKQALQALEAGSRELATLSRLIRDWQLCKDEAAIFEALQKALPTLLPGSAGAVFDTETDTLFAKWGEPARFAALVDCACCGAPDKRCPLAERGEGENSRCCELAAQGERFGKLVAVFGNGEQAGRGQALFDSVIEPLTLSLANLRLRQRLSDMALRDALTGLYNRHYLENWLPTELARCERLGRPLTLMVLDIDRFKRFNDRYGHPAGDAVLREVGRYLVGALRAYDMACRLGGEEFVLVFPEMGVDVARERAEQIRRGVKALKVAEAGGAVLGGITASLGVAVYPEQAADLRSLLAEADRAAYQAKANGRDRVCGSLLSD
ncbi:diguanylate cyclase [Crenobacter cavernae]|uniref:Diguanylate cyclase n=1 Tax=Crenobacter cavernae TaxID=2290923 RepID=A0A345Y981_9NEIS|nr:diguanylate cyclase [Crenobacter cavernae]AXK40483.1 diguanylate cyclase [Crenobacter cavernae]